MLPRRWHKNLKVCWRNNGARFRPSTENWTQMWETNGANDFYINYQIRNLTWQSGRASPPNKKIIPEALRARGGCQRIFFFWSHHNWKMIWKLNSDLFSSGWLVGAPHSRTGLYKPCLMLVRPYLFINRGTMWRLGLGLTDFLFFLTAFDGLFGLQCWKNGLFWTGFGHLLVLIYSFGSFRSWESCKWWIDSS